MKTRSFVKYRESQSEPNRAKQRPKESMKTVYGVAIGVGTMLCFHEFSLHYEKRCTDTSSSCDNCCLYELIDTICVVCVLELELLESPIHHRILVTIYKSAPDP